ncbi:competence protein CoiA family protein (plasmid) [Kitasatospora purpeofusca]|uniref:competence protein CoiA family protein n=1 Tax=Kitasatospora purpeofusca TaxID=67352 RepID=UPI002E0FE867|nr:competence protein CoiA family protein [Kitasatospora purpeofusca]
MAFRAVHAHWGTVFAHLPDLGCGQAWETVWKARPAAPLACPECLHPVHAKVSRGGLRFFAHAPRPPHCEIALQGESEAHHLLKLELAGAARDAGAHAELEVRAADGSWRADVLATDPAGTWRTALEAQLSPITADTITTRTERMQADGVTSCWFSDRPRPPWLGAVPSLRLATTDAGLLVTEGLVKFAGGSWTAVPPVPVAEFLRWAFTGKVEQHAPRSPLGYPARQLARVWTAPTYVAAEDAHLVDVRRREQERERRLAEQRAEAAKRRAEIDTSNVLSRAEALELAAEAEEQVRLAPSGPAEVSHHVLKMNRGVRQAIAYLAREFGIAAEIGWSSSDPRWAGGTPLVAEDGTPVAVVDPAPFLIKGEAFRLLAGMLLLFATPADVQRFDRTTRGARKPRVPVDGWKMQHTGPESPASPAAPAAAPKGRAPRLVSRPCPRAADVDAE